MDVSLVIHWDTEKEAVLRGPMQTLNINSDSPISTLKEGSSMDPSRVVGAPRGPFRELLPVIYSNGQGETKIKITAKPAKFW